MNGMKERQKNWVQLCWSGCPSPPIHRRDPTTARHGDFCLLCFHPGPIRPSLDNLEIPSSPETTILMPSLVRTPDRHRSTMSRAPDLKPSTNSGFPAAGLQDHANGPSQQQRPKIQLKSRCTFLNECDVSFQKDLKSHV